MKRIAFLFIFPFFCFVSYCYASVNSDILQSFPSVIDLSMNPDGVIFIHPPATHPLLEGHQLTDVNGDGYDDIVAAGVTPNPVYTGIYEAVYMIYGGNNFKPVVEMDNYLIRKSKLLWQSKSDIYRAPLHTGDFNGDDIPDIVFPIGLTEIPKDFIVFVIIFGRKEWNTEAIISETMEGASIIYAYTSSDFRASRRIKYEYRNSLIVDDMNGDGMDDIVLNYPINIFRHLLTLGKLYIVHGERSMPPDINALDTPLRVTTILADTLYMLPFYHSIASGDFDGDNKKDLILEGGRSRMNIMLAEAKEEAKWHYGLTYTINNELLSNSFYIENGLSLEENMHGLTRITRNERYFIYNTTYNVLSSDIDHFVSAGDINGDGCDEVFIAYPNSPIKPEGAGPEGYSDLYILSGNKDFQISGNLDYMSTGITKITSAFKGDRLGMDFAFGDVNGDGYKDCLIGGLEESFFLLYGSPTLPDSFQIGESFPQGVIINKGKFTAMGDFNGDGYDDILGNKDNGIFIILGRGRHYNTGNTIIKPLPGSSKSKYKFQFSDGTDFRFHFTKGRPYTNTELHLTNFGRQLPDSLQSVHTGGNVVSFYQMDLTDMYYSYRVKCYLGYTDSLLNELNIEEADLAVSYWDGENQKWTNAESTVDTMHNYVTIITDHMSLWALHDINDPIIADVEGPDIQVPLTFQLEQNYPNPFNPVTTIRYQIPKTLQVSLKIYNILGQEVKTLVNEPVSAGSYETLWDGTDGFGNKVSSGIYLYRLETDGGYGETRKLVLLK